MQLGTHASVVPPSACPITIVAREIGATSTPCRKPSRAILDRRDSREDRSEQQHQHDEARIEILEVVDIRPASRPD